VIVIPAQAGIHFMEFKWIPDHVALARGRE
jgi:hypothetical protein